MNRLKQSIFSVLTAGAIFFNTLPRVFAYDETSVTSLTLQPGADATRLNITWYAEGDFDEVMPKVFFGGKEYSAEKSKPTVPTDKDEETNPYGGYVICSAEIEGLMPDTEYTYTLSNNNGASCSENYTYKTPGTDAFRFAFTSDPQIKESGETDPGGWNPSDNTNKTGWQKMMTKIAGEGATLIVSAGDQVEDQSWGKKAEYDAFFAPKEMSQIAYAPAVGNHDRHYMFRDHFNLPNEMNTSSDETDDDRTLTEVKTTFRGQNSGASLSHGNYTKADKEEISENKNEKGVTPNEDGIYDYVERREMETEGNYYYLYNNALFVTLNTSAYPGGNDSLEGENTTLQSAQAENEAVNIVGNFEKTLAAAVEDYKGQFDWLIVTHHKSTQTVAKHAADSDIENYVDAGFEKLMEKYDVDFVLGGHDHVYSRSYVLNGNGERVSERLDTINSPEGTIYLTANCASDMQYYTPFEKLDKTNNADYPVLANGEIGSEGYLKGQTAENKSDYLPIGNQEYNQEYSPSYAIFDVTSDTVSVKVYNLDGNSEKPSSKLIDSFTVTKNKNAQITSKGFENGSSAIDISQIARYDSGITNADGGVMEIVDYNATTGRAYAINAQAGILTAISMGDLANNKALLDGYDIEVKKLIQDEDFVYGDMTSVTVSPDGKRLAVSVQEKAYDKNGRAVIFSCNADGTLTFERAIETGVQPDMITFTPDGKYILTANEGEARKGDSATDPEGSVTVIDTSTWTATNAGFENFTHKSLAAKGIVIKKDKTPSEDLEPEYIAADNQTAYITLQEANAVAVLDIETKKITNIHSLGTVDFNKVKIDLDKGDGKYSPDNYNIYGLRMPDGISMYKSGDKTYLLTANEGDSREWGKEGEEGYHTNELNEKIFSKSGVKTEKKVTYFDKIGYDGLDLNKEYLFGTRSFTLFEVSEDKLIPIFDSGSDFEKKTANYLPEYFNCSNDSLDIDDRSNKKGVEPETVTTGVIDGKTYAFITLERIGGVMIYDITNPTDVKYENYINSRDFSVEIGKDSSPEGLKFISAEKSPTGEPLLLAACEVGGTVAVYQISKGAGLNEKSSVDNSSVITAPLPVGIAVAVGIAVVLIAAAVITTVIIRKKKR